MERFSTKSNCLHYTNMILFFFLLDSLCSNWAEIHIRKIIRWKYWWNWLLCFNDDNNHAFEINRKILFIFGLNCYRLVCPWSLFLSVCVESAKGFLNGNIANVHFKAMANLCGSITHTLISTKWALAISLSRCQQQIMFTLQRASPLFRLLVFSSSSIFIPSTNGFEIFVAFHNNRIHFYHLDPFAIEIKIRQMYTFTNEHDCSYYFTLGRGREERDQINRFYNHN